MPLDLFDMTAYIDAIKRADIDAVAECLANPDIAENEELNFEALERAIDADLGKGTHLKIVNLILSNPKIKLNITQNANQALRSAVVVSPCIARRLLAVPEVRNLLTESVDCKKLISSIATAGVINQRQIVCEIAAIVWPRFTVANCPDGLRKIPLLPLILGPQRDYFRSLYAQQEFKLKVFPRDVTRIIYSFLYKSGTDEDEAVSLDELRTLLPSRLSSTRLKSS